MTVELERSVVDLAGIPPQVVRALKVAERADSYGKGALVDGVGPDPGSCRLEAIERLLDALSEADCVGQDAEDANFWVPFGDGNFTTGNLPIAKMTLRENRNMQILSFGGVMQMNTERLEGISIRKVSKDELGISVLMRPNGGGTHYIVAAMYVGGPSDKWAAFWKAVREHELPE